MRIKKMTAELVPSHGMQDLRGSSCIFYNEGFYVFCILKLIEGDGLHVNKFFFPWYLLGGGGVKDRLAGT
jgi:hypothetical protein